MYLDTGGTEVKTVPKLKRFTKHLKTSLSHIIRGKSIESAIDLCFFLIHFVRSASVDPCTMHFTNIIQD